MASGVVVLMTKALLPRIVSVKVFVAVLLGVLRSVTTMSNAYVPATVGVPLKTPLLDSAMPGGSETLLGAVHVYGCIAPSAEKMFVANAPTTALGNRLGVLMTSRPGSLTPSVNVLLTELPALSTTCSVKPNGMP